MAETSTYITLGFDTKQALAQLRRDLQAIEKSSTFSPKVDGKNFSQPLGRINSDLNNFNDALTAANKRVIAFGASASIFASFLRGLKEIGSATIQVNKAFTEINSILRLSSGELTKFSGKLFQVAKDTGSSFDDAAQAALEFSRQGLGLDETLKRTASTLTLVRQSGLDVNKSIQSITAAINTFKNEGLDSTQVVNKLIAVDSKYAVSARDLAEAISRVGSTAQSTGVSFDKLVGIITAAQQLTARGGTVIGNSLKTIFTRIERTDTLDQLQALGITVRDLKNNVLPADQILKNLAGSFDNLGESQKTAVKQLVAGTFQINQLNAILGDLSSGFSTVEQAMLAASYATTEATKRNELLNKSYSAIIQNAKTAFTEVSSAAGSIVFDKIIDPFKSGKSLNFISDLIKGSIKPAENRGFGEEIAHDIFAGIGNVITGPGLLAIVTLAINVIKKSLGTLASSVTSIGGFSFIKEKDLELTKQIGTALGYATEEEKRRFAISNSLQEKEEIILNVLKAQTAERTKQIYESGQLVASLQKNNPNIGRVLSTGSLPNLAGGFMPISAEQHAINNGVGGASTNARPVVIPNFSFGKGKRGTIVANSDEYLVPNFANGGSAIFNRDMIRTFGLPLGAQKINAADGFVPNFSFSALEKAINREMSSGVPMSQIYLDKDSRLRSPDNPMGLLVANKRDEPFGGKQGVDNAIKLGKDPKKNGIAAMGFVPNFSFNDPVYGPNFQNYPDFKSIIRGKQLREYTGRGEESTFISKETTNEIKRIFEEYKVAVAKGSTVLKAELQKQLKELELETKSLNSVRVIFEDYEKQVKSDLAADTAERKSQLAITKSIARNKEKVLKQQNEENLKQEKLSQINADARTVPIFGLSNGQTNSIPYSPSKVDGAKLAAEADAIAKQFYDSIRQTNRVTNNLPPTQRELDINKLVTSLSNNQIKNVLGSTGNAFDSRREGVNTIRSILKESSTVNTFKGRTLVNQDSINSLVSLGRSGTLDGDFITRVKDELVKNSKTLEEAYGVASKAYIESGGSARQLAKAQTKYLGTLLDFESQFKESAAAKAQADKEEKLAKAKNDEIFKSQASKQRQLDTALKLSFLAPFAAGFIPEGKNGTASGIAKNGASGALNGLGIGAGIATTFGLTGAPLIALALGGTLLFGLRSVLGSLTKNLEDFAKIVEETNSKRRLESESIQQYILAQENINQAIERGDSDQKLSSLRSQQSAALFRINDPSTRASLVGAGSNLDALSEILLSKNGKNNAISDANNSLSSLFAAGKSGGLFGGAATKETTNAIDGLIASTNLSDKKIAKAFDTLKTDFDSKGLTAVTEYFSTLGASAELIDDTQKLFKNKPELIGFIFKSFIEKMNKFSKDAEISNESFANATYNVRFSKAFLQAGKQISLNSELGSQNSLTGSAIEKSRQSTFLNIASLPNVEKLRKETEFSLLNAGNDLSNQISSSISKSLSSVLGLVGQSSSSKPIPYEANVALTNLLQKKDNINENDFKELSKSFEDGNKEISQKLLDSYNELVLIRNAGENQIRELKENGRLQILQARSEQRGRLLQNGTYNSGNIEALKSLRLDAATNTKYKEGGVANQFNAFSDQIDLLDKLGFSETSKTKGIRDSIRQSSVQTNISKYLSEILNRQIDDTTDSINSAIEEILKKKTATIQDVVDKDAANRIKEGLSSLKDSPDKLISQLSSKENLGKFISSGKISLGEGGVLSNLEKISSPLSDVKERLGDNGPIATLLAQIEANTKIRDQSRKVEEDRKTVSSLSLQIENLKNSPDINSLNKLNIGKAFRPEQNTVLGLGPFSTVSSPQSLENLKDPIQLILEKAFKEAGFSRFVANDFQDTLASAKNIDPKRTTVELLNSLKSNDEFKTKNLISEGELSKVIDTLISKFQVQSPELTALNAQKQKAESQLNRSNFDQRLNLGSPKEIDIFKAISAKATASASPAITPISSTPSAGSTFSAPQVEQITKNTERLTDKQRELKELTASLAVSEAKLKDVATLSLQQRIELTQKLVATQLQIARENNDALKTFTLGFKGYFENMKNQMNDLSSIGDRLASSLDNNLGGAFGDFITGTKSAGEAFKGFVTSVLSDAARALASKAVSNLLTSFISGFGGGSSGASAPAGGAMGYAAGGSVLRFATGGGVPAMVMGGEYYFTPQETKRIGKNVLDQMNQGVAPKYADGGMIKGGSGVRDDIPATLDVGGYVLKKSAVNKYGEKYLENLSDDKVQHKFIGGILLGALLGGTIGALTNKKNRGKGFLSGALIGGLAGGALSFVGGGLGAASGAAGAGASSGGGTAATSLFGGASTSAATASTLSFGQQTAIMLGATALLGGATYLASRGGKKSSAPVNYLTDQQKELDAQRASGQFAYLQQGENGAMNIGSYGREAATRRYASGGLITGGSGTKDDLFTRLSSNGYVLNKTAVSRIGKSNLDNLASGGTSVNISKFADGGEVGAPTSVNIGNKSSNSSEQKSNKSGEPDVYVKIEINNNGQVSSSQEANPKSPLGEAFMKKLQPFVVSTIREELISQQRNGGLLKQNNSK